MMWSVGLKGHTYLHGVYISGLHRNCYPTENMSPQPCAELHVTKGVAHYSAQSIFMSKYLPFFKKKKKIITREMVFPWHFKTFVSTKRSVVYIVFGINGKSYMRIFTLDARCLVFSCFFLLKVLGVTKMF